MYTEECKTMVLGVDLHTYGKHKEFVTSYWQEISFGDGFDVVPDKDDSRYGWSMSQQGFVSR